MFTVVLVDDEPWALRGLRQSYPWEERGFRITAETTDPEKALRILCEDTPDLVISDIRMPELSGIDLLRKARAAGITSEAVIVSGYREFEWARQALDCGVTGYLLKPIDQAELERLMDSVAARLEQKRRGRGLVSVGHLVAGGFFDTERIQALFEEQGMGGVTGPFHALILSGPPNHSALPLAAMLAPASVRLEVSEQKAMAILVGVDRVQEVRDRYARIGDSPDITVGLSSASGDRESLAGAVRQADIACWGYYGHRVPGLYVYREPDSLLVKSLTEPPVRALRAGRPQEALASIEGLPAIILAHRFTVEEIAALYNGIVSTVDERDRAAGAGPGPGPLTYDQIVARFPEAVCLCRHLSELINDRGPARAPVSARVPVANESFARLLDHVERHYREKLGLEELSHMFGLNPTYICELFRKVMGTSLTRYVMNLRLTKAGELLAATGAAVYQIAEDVGYEDCYYFDKLFKRCFGMTPTEYRTRVRR